MPLDTKCVRHSVHRDIRRNFQGIYNNHRILMMGYCSTDEVYYDKETKLVPFVKKLIYKYISLNCYVQT